MLSSKGELGERTPLHFWVGESMGDIDLSKPDTRAVELSFRKSTGSGISKEEEEELKKLQQEAALKRRAQAFSDPGPSDGSPS